MPKFCVDYYETYRGSYEVEAETEEEAEELVKAKICEGEFDEPDCCEKSWCETLENKKFKVKIVETYSREVEVAAFDEDSAYDIVNAKIDEGKIDLPCDGDGYDYDRELFVNEVKEKK